MKSKSVLAFFLSILIALSGVSVVFADDGSTLKILSGQRLSKKAYVAADIYDGELFTVTYDYGADNNKYTVSVYDAETAELIKSKEKTVSLEVISECEIKSDGSYVLYDYYNGKSIIYNSDLSYREKSTCETKSYDYDELYKENSLVSGHFLKDEFCARFTDKNDFTPSTYAIAFPDDSTCVYLTSDGDVTAYYAASGKKLFGALEQKSNQEYAGAAVYDFNAKTYVKTQTPSFKGYNYNAINLADMDETYAFFTVESDKTDSSYTTPFIWKYSAESEASSFTAAKVNAKTVKKYNNNYIDRLKNDYAVNILVDKLPSTYPTYWDEEKGEEYGGVVKGAGAFDTYIILKNLIGYLSYFPKNFTQEMAYFDGKKHSFDIYIDKEIIGAAAAFANRYDGFLICFATDEFSSSFIPHEFLHLIDARIDYYLKSKGKDYEVEWDKLNPKNFFYYAEQDYNPKYFASYYAMSDSREDRADTFQYLFEAYNSAVHPYTQNAVRRKAIYLTELIRQAYPSVQNLSFASWEKWIMPYPVKAKAKSTESSLKVYWSACRNVKKYILQQKVNGVWKTVYTGKNRSYKLKKLKSGKAYSFRVRALRLDGKRKVYSSWEYIYTATKPKTPAKFSVKTNSKHQIIARWSKVKACSGYQVQYAKDKSFKKKIATRDVAKGKKSYTGKNFTKGNTYYVRIRTYVVSGDKRIYSPWTAAKIIKSK